MGDVGEAGKVTGPGQGRRDSRTYDNGTGYGEMLVVGDAALQGIDSNEAKT